jgi:hypothetical protein
MKAVFVFCEGAHDVQFLGRALSACRDFVTIDKVQELPAPLDGFLQARLAGEQTKLNAISYARVNQISLPRLERVLKSADGSRVVMLFACEGEGQHKKIVELLESLEKSLKARFDSAPVAGQAPKKRVEQWATVLCYDADDKGIDVRVSDIQRDYGRYFGDLAGLAESKWLDTPKGPLACIVFHGLPGGLGTLEDIVTPMIRERLPEEMSASERFVEATMWEGCLVRGKADPPAIATLTKRKKAALTVLAQFDHPSYALSVFIRDTQLLTAEALKAEAFCTSVAVLIADS